MRMNKFKEKLEFGRTGLKIPPIIFGTSSLGNLYKALSYKEKLEIISQMIQSVESPVVIDTAGKYGAGLSLEVIGNAIKDLNITDEKVTISNKLGWLRTPLRTKEPTFEPGVWANLENDAKLDISYTGILRCWEQGCELLGENSSGIQY